MKNILLIFLFTVAVVTTIWTIKGTKGLKTVHPVDSVDSKEEIARKLVGLYFIHKLSNTSQEAWQKNR